MTVDKVTRVDDIEGGLNFWKESGVEFGPDWFSPEFLERAFNAGLAAGREEAQSPAAFNEWFDQTIGWRKRIEESARAASEA